MCAHSVVSNFSNIERGEKGSYTKLLNLNHRKQKKGKKQRTSKIIGKLYQSSYTNNHVKCEQSKYRNTKTDGMVKKKSMMQLYVAYKKPNIKTQKKIKRIDKGMPC